MKVYIDATGNAQPTVTMTEKSTFYGREVEMPKEIADGIQRVLTTHGKVRRLLDFLYASSPRNVAHRNQIIAELKEIVCEEAKPEKQPKKQGTAARSKSESRRLQVQTASE